MTRIARRVLRYVLARPAPTGRGLAHPDPDPPSPAGDIRAVPAASDDHAPWWLPSPDSGGAVTVSVTVPPAARGTYHWVYQAEPTGPAEAEDGSGVRCRVDDYPVAADTPPGG